MPSAARQNTAKVKASVCDVAEHLLTTEESAVHLEAWPDEAPDEASGITRAGSHFACRQYIVDRSRCQ